MRLSLLSALLTLIAAVLWHGTPAVAHEVRPALLQITEQAGGRYDILWKRPTQGGATVALVPHISGSLLEGKPTNVEAGEDFEMYTWRNLEPGADGLDGRTLEIEGLARTITDVLVVVTLANGDRIQEILRPQSPSLVLHLHKAGLDVSAYIVLGVEHILAGIDHLSFVLGLMLLVRGWVQLIKTVTAFTVAHSITLAATALHIITVRSALIEALVALSILFVAIEVVHSFRGRRGVTQRYPWLIALTFGLLHGCAFAGALAEIGLPQNAIAVSLFLFNVGVEIGQLVFVAAVLCVTYVLARLPKGLPAWTRWLPPYAIGTLAAFWFIDRLHTAII